MSSKIKPTKPKVVKKSKMQLLMDEFDFDDKLITLTKPIKKAKKFTKYYDQIPHIANYNFMEDLLFMPESKKTKNKYLVVCLDLATNLFDCEPVKNKDSSTVLTATKLMFKRGDYIKKPYASIRTDNGGEFKHEFHDYMYENSILHTFCLPARHSQMAPVDNLCRTLGKFFNLYMNKIELQTKKVYTDWDDIVDVLRTKLNKIREKKTENPRLQYIEPPDTTYDPLYKVGDLVYHQLDTPQNALGHSISGKFREGDYRFDKFPRKVIKVLVYSGHVPYRYMLDNIPQCSYTEAQLKAVDEIQDDAPPTEEMFIFQSFKGKRTVNKQIQYQVKWKKDKNLTWELKTNLIEDGLQDEINEFEESLKKKKSKK